MAKRWVFRDERCKGCGLCVEACPEDILYMSDKVNRQGYVTAQITDHEKCISCGFCALSCPDVAIEVFRPLKKARAKAAEDGRKEA